MHLTSFLQIREFIIALQTNLILPVNNSCIIPYFIFWAKKEIFRGTDPKMDFKQGNRIEIFEWNSDNTYQMIAITKYIPDWISQWKFSPKHTVICLNSLKKKDYFLSLSSISPNPNLLSNSSKRSLAEWTIMVTRTNGVANNNNAIEKKILFNFKLIIFTYFLGS